MRFTKVLLALLLAASAAGAADILINSSFESWLFGMPVGWLTSELTSSGSAVQDSNSHTGSWCVKLTAIDTAAYLASATLVQAGNSYDFSGFVCSPGLLGGSFVLQFTTLTGSLVGSPVLIPAYYSGASYRQYSQWVTAPDSAALVAVTFVTAVGLTAYVDDVTLDDTTIAGVEQPPAAAVGPWKPALRKVVSVGGVQPRVSGALYDPLGRRVYSARRSGVYFLR